MSSPGSLPASPNGPAARAFPPAGSPGSEAGASGRALSPVVVEAGIQVMGGRAERDACPGALRLHEAADGPLARIRVPGGRISGAQLGTLRELAAAWGDGHVELTSRANLQLRALTGVPETRLADRLAAAGLLPSDTHELVRNIAASPLISGRDAGLVRELDEALCADAGLAGLPGRFLFAIDDGAGDVAYAADVAALRLGTGGAGRFAMLFAGRDVGLRVGRATVVSALLTAARAFLVQVEGAVATGARRSWRVRELTDGPGLLGRDTARALDITLGEVDPELRRPGVQEPIGVVPQGDGRVAVAALVPLGRLDDRQLRVLAGADELVFTPWRGVVLPGVAPEAADEWLDALAGAGLEVGAGSRWVGVTACAGRPGCAKSLADVRHDADAATVAGDGLPVHWVGCARGCGSPAAAHVRVEATVGGYAVTVRSGSSAGRVSDGETTGNSTARSAGDGTAGGGTGQSGRGDATGTGRSAGGDATDGSIGTGDGGTTGGVVRGDRLARAVAAARRGSVDGSTAGTREG
ncbi:precorrin-3B synthase [Symbioplanes lichenis]|uniref:precorrin-3B synthase n=1 Tax=Symbioplanes lichenis TaxID=1629072 RepID=UPI00273A39EC|nr:precorrin-3B synthase [Actinoplanes lichenis]